jgi:hypothetical protein
MYIHNLDYSHGFIHNFYYPKLASFLIFNILIRSYTMKEEEEYIMGIYSDI